MIKCEVIENFTLEKHNELKNVKKVVERKNNEFGVRDTFECTKDMAEYLTGKNVLNKTVVKIIEVIPEIKELEPVSINDPVGEKGEKFVAKKTTKKKK